MIDLVWPSDVILVIFLGLSFGSFCTAIYHRELNDLPWLMPAKRGVDQIDVYRSICPHCKHKLGFFDLIPVLSWLFLRGRCRYCGQPICPLYPIIELTTVVLCLAIWGLHGFAPSAIAMMACVPFLLALCIIDLKVFLLPNKLVAAVGLLGFANIMITSAEGALLFALAQAALSGLVYGLFILVTGYVVSRVLKKDALGGGDVKFFFAAGVWLGPAAFPVYCILSGVLGVVIGFSWQSIKKDPVFPFGPALIAALFVLMLIDSSFFINLL